MLLIATSHFLITSNCAKCHRDTKWEVEFHAYDFKTHNVEFICVCRKCLERTPQMKGLLVCISAQDWVKITPEEKFLDS